MTARITEPMKAGWAMAHVKVECRRQLNAALRRACVTPSEGELGAVPPRDAVAEVGRVGRSIVAASDAALALLDGEST